MAMATNDFLPRRFDMAMRRMAFGESGIKSAMLNFNPRYHTVYSHFIGDALTAEWATAKTNGTSAAVTVASSDLTCTSGTDDDGYAGQAFGLHWQGQYGFYFMCEVTPPGTITTWKMEVGITDATDDAGAIATKATPTATATDAVVLVYDTDDNTELDIIEVNNGAVAAVAENVHTVAAATSFLVEFVGSGTEVAVYVNGQLKGVGTLTSTVSVTPWIFSQSRAGSASRATVSDWWFMTGPNV